MNKLTPEEFDLLQVAMESHKSRTKEGNMIGDLFVTLLTAKLPDEEKAKIKAEDAERKAKLMKTTQLALEQITVLQAKLILMRDQIVIQELIS